MYLIQNYLIEAVPEPLFWKASGQLCNPTRLRKSGFMKKTFYILQTKHIHAPSKTDEGVDCCSYRARLTSEVCGFCFLYGFREIVKGR